MTTWNSQFANNPQRGYDVYLELLEDEQPQAQIMRDVDGELYLSIFTRPDIKIPFAWLAELRALAETLPAPEPHAST